MEAELSQVGWIFVDEVGKVIVVLKWLKY
ncbi:hypothetical protein TorRG33x02_104200 [Trema orientale]|uniref:Uncharacterized protein n=1 Tax=Trema orientale TaxID=63057 RepID=A0A2P5F7G5_TREOI|nr:hypothetical protein TorRG33x02_104200 [Trema orientale]